MVENSEVCRSQLGDGSYEDGEALWSRKASDGRGICAEM